MATTTAVPKTRISGGSFLLESRRTDEVFTPEDFTEQQQLIGQTAEEFTVNEILPNAEKIEHKDFSISRELIKKAGDLGLSGVEIPEAYGGLDMDKVTAAVIADHIAKTRISGGSFLLESRRTDEVFTPEDFTEQQQLIGQTAEEFTVNEILPNAEKIEHKDFSISREL